jgi:hypothetical protein
MSLLSTESFMAFSQWTGDDAYNTANTAMRKAFQAAFKRAGYQSLIGDNTDAQTSGAFIVRPDPVYPDRQALVFSSGNTNNASKGSAYTTQAGIKKPLASQGDVVIGGFSLYVPPEYVPNTYGVSTVGVLYCIGTLATDQSFVPGVANCLFAISSDLAISNYNGVRQSTKTLVPGRLAFIEYRVSDADVKVWVDDVLVLQNVVSPPTDAIGFTLIQNNVTAPATFMQGAAGRWAISNWYNLVEDSQAPNVRLGPTTRISGVRANNDVDVDFVRPVDAPSNAAVAGQDLVDAPTWTLQSSNAGDQDIYSTDKDTSTSSGKLVHAVVTKVLASNLESNPHTLRALVVSPGGVEKEDPKPRTLVTLASLPNGKHTYSVNRRPTDGKVFAAGIGPSLTASGPAADANTQWTLISDEGNANNWGLVCFRSDGTGIIVRNDYKVQIIPPGSDTPGAAIAISAISGYAPNCTLVLPDNTILVGANGGRVWRCAGDKDPALPASWTLLVPSTAAVGALLYHPGLGRVVAAVAATSVFTSDDKGLTWTARPTGIATSMSEGLGANQLGFDGTWFTIMSQNTASANYIKRSQDGVSWASPTYNTNGSPQFVINFSFGDPVSGVILNASGMNTTVTTQDGGANWRRQPLLPGNPYAACALPNGDWFIVGQNGMMMAYTTALIDTPLTPLAGYVPAYNVATTNPDTGAAWTPAEAAAAKFGMRVTS